MVRKIPEVITEEEIIKILVNTKNNKHKLAFMLGFYQALRVSEIVNLKPQNVDKQQHIIKIVQGKGKKDRVIPIVKPVKMPPTAVQFALNKLPVATGVRSLQIAFKRKARKILNKDLHFHTLRHSGASWLLNVKKWDIRQIQRFLGHSNLKTTEIYTHVTPTDLVNLDWES